MVAFSVRGRRSQVPCIPVTPLCLHQTKCRRVALHHSTPFCCLNSMSCFKRTMSLPHHHVGKIGSNTGVLQSMCQHIYYKHEPEHALTATRTSVPPIRQRAEPLACGSCATATSIGRQSSQPRPSLRRPASKPCLMYTVSALLRNITLLYFPRRALVRAVPSLQKCQALGRGLANPRFNLSEHSRT